MKVLVSKKPTESTQIKARAHFTATGFTLTTTKYGEKSWTFDPSKIEAWPDMMSVVQDQFGNFVFYWFSEIINNRDGLVAQAVRKQVFDAMARYAVQIALCPDGVWLPYFGNGYTEITWDEGLDIEVIEVGYTKGTVAYRPFIPQFYPYLAKCRAKQRALGRINVPDNLAALEMQVDFLTTLVESLIKGEAAPAWAQEFIDACKASDSRQVYPNVAAALAEVDANKTATRAIQAAYFGEVSEILAGRLPENLL
jgi:hypothetical protein